MPSFFHGNRGSVIVGSTTMCITEWSVTPEAEMIDVTGTCSDGYEELLDSIVKCTGMFKGFWDAAANPTTNPPNLNVGASVALKCYLKNTSSPYWNFPIAKITTFPVTSGVRKGVEYTCNFRSSGTFSPPVGNF